MGDPAQHLGPDSNEVFGIFEPDVGFSLEEANGEVGGKHVLGRVRGTFFVPEGVSRNNRYYPKELWEKVVNDPMIKKRLEERRMFGTISHEQPLDDKALLEGKISHIVTDLQIKEGKQGYGEALILDTPAGNILYRVLQAGAKLFVSSRANGQFKGEEKGIPKVDPETFQLNTFDFVMDPGFIQANPQMESLQEALNKLKKLEETMGQQGNQPNQENNNTKGDEQMGQQNNQDLLEKLSKQNSDLESQLNNATQEVERLKQENTTLTDENNNLKEEMKNYKQLSEEVEKYRALGTPEEIEEAFESAEKLHEDNKKITEELGSADEIEESIDAATSLIEEYKELGSPSEVSEALNAAEKKLDEYAEYGTPEEIGQVFERAENMVEEKKKEKEAKEVAELANEIGVTEEKVRTLYGKISNEEIKKVLGEGKTSNGSGKPESLTERFKKKGTSQTQGDGQGEGEKKTPFNEARVNRLIRRTGSIKKSEPVKSPRE